MNLRELIASVSSFTKERLFFGIIGVLGILISSGIYWTASKIHTQALSVVPQGSFHQYLLKNDSVLNSRWDPGAMLASRSWFSYRTAILGIADTLWNTSNAFDVWQHSSRRKSDIPTYMHLAIMAGDLSSAYKLSLESGESGRLVRLLTKTFWQSANEYLIELDFARASQYNSLYLMTLQSTLEGGEEFNGHGANRNRTLSHILQREIITRRILSLCHKPSLAAKFSSLLGGGYGYSIRDLERFNDLPERININAKFYCQGNISDIVPYSEIFNIQPRTQACKLWPIECKYNRLINLMSSRALYESLVELYSFSNSCTYLTDDVNHVFFKRLRRSADISKPIILPSTYLRKIISCVKAQKADGVNALLSDIRYLSCDNILWENETLDFLIQKKETCAK